MSLPGYKATVVKVSRCRNERQKRSGMRKAGSREVEKKRVVVSKLKLWRTNLSDAHPVGQLCGQDSSFWGCSKIISIHPQAVKLSLLGKAYCNGGKLAVGIRLRQTVEPPQILRLDR